MFRPSLTLIALAVSAPSFANDAPKDMERIIVSGSRVIESIDEVPASITVISRKQIEDHLKVNPRVTELVSADGAGLRLQIQVVRAILASRCADELRL